jgi:hypothetical protein
MSVLDQAGEAKAKVYAILKKFIPQESIDQAWQEIEEAGIFSGKTREGMNYEQALERAKTNLVMRPHWRRHWLTFENGQHVELRDDGSTHKWCPQHHGMAATDWCDAPQSPDEP